METSSEQVSNNECTASYNQPTVYHEVWNKLIEIVWNLAFMVTMNQPNGECQRCQVPRHSRKTVDLSNSGHWLGFLRLRDAVDDAAFDGSFAASIGSKSWRSGWWKTPVVWQVCTMIFFSTGFFWKDIPGYSLCFWTFFGGAWWQWMPMKWPFKKAAKTLQFGRLLLSSFRSASASSVRNALLATIAEMHAWRRCLGMWLESLRAVTWEVGTKKQQNPVLHRFRRFSLGVNMSAGLGMLSQHVFTCIYILVLLLVFLVLLLSSLLSLLLFMIIIIFLSFLLVCSNKMPPRPPFWTLGTQDEKGLLICLWSDQANS